MEGTHLSGIKIVVVGDTKEITAKGNLTHVTYLVRKTFEGNLTTTTISFVGPSQLDSLLYQKVEGIVSIRIYGEWELLEVAELLQVVAGA